MKRWVFILFLLNVSAARAQSAQQLLDSSKAVRFSDFSQSLEYANRSYLLARQQKDSAAMAAANVARGIAHYVLSDFEAALPCYLQALDYYEHHADTLGMINTYAELIIFYRHERKDRQARQAINSSLQLAAAINDLNGLANLNNNAGLFYQTVEDYDSAAFHFRKGLNYYAQLQDKVGMSYSLDYLATALGKTGQLSEALVFAHQSRDLRLQTGDRLGVSESINNIGELLLLQDKAAQALGWFRAARDTAMRLNYKDLAAHTWQMEAKALEKTGHFQEAYNALKRYQELREGLLNEKRAAAIEELQTKYETEKKERKNLELQQINRTQELDISRRNMALLGIAVFVLLAAGLAYGLYHRYRLRQQVKLQEERLHQERLRAEAIVATEEHERQRLARELHDGVGQTLAAARRSLQRSLPATADHQPLALLDDSITEVRTLSHAMMPPALRNRSLTEALEELTHRLSRSSGIQIATDWSNARAVTLDRNQSLMIYRAIQELLSNAIRHADANEIQIEMVDHGDSLNILVMDNGRGYTPGTIAEGLGLKNIQSRIGFIGGEVILDSQPGQGATCIIDVPIARAQIPGLKQ